MLAIWSLVPLHFLNPAWTSGSSQFMYCWRLAWRILSTTLPACEMSGIRTDSNTLFYGRVMFYFIYIYIYHSFFIHSSVNGHNWWDFFFKNDNLWKYPKKPSWVLCIPTLLLHMESTETAARSPSSPDQCCTPRRRLWLSHWRSLTVDQNHVRTSPIQLILQVLEQPKKVRSVHCLVVYTLCVKSSLPITSASTYGHEREKVDDTMMRTARIY